ncbi:MAG: hypothetical protein M5R36_06915 [Deltaproteobacteria bacterium]|nr:hypothetical protein [Deltaproteobacteria bacterium]
MPYDIDERDVFFCLFDHMRLGEMPRLAPYKDHDEEMYRMVVSEAIKFAREKVAPTNIPADEEGVRMENGEVKMPPVFLPSTRNIAKAAGTPCRFPRRSAARDCRGSSPRRRPKRSSARTARSP